ncbi:DUF4129 domain-containing protein [Stieleria varia]|uniref:Ribonuclease E n=1 Tax=Stieleria varia TaxID=2528005 RepID=A0A5C6A0I3_9BACT|nr:DUF4129 domain-containing protein [Stieleria varia]TWT93334.1 Ribonuclease E [Stieleria varia]
MAPPKTVADYAAIAVAPILIFVMISSLAQFFVLLIYQGGFGGRVSWILLMYTMGSVAVARVSIEQSREYSIGYLGALGAAALLVLSQYVGSPLLAIPILVMIAYLSDRITYDCTLIDDDVDASGEGLMDSGRILIRQNAEALRKTNDQTSPEADNAVEPTAAPPRKTHQPGRTVFYLALAALPLFGLGQFFLGGNDLLWSQSLKFLALYLFSSLSLLVTTSFLGLRRYLRQRQVDMPHNVSVAWLAGGLGLIAIVLLVAYIAPLPGQLLASLEPPAWLTTPDEKQASSQGWGDEAAEKSDEQSAQTDQDRKPQGKQTQGKSDRERQPGEASEGDPNAKNRDSQSAPPSDESSDKGKSGASEQESSSPDSSGQPSEQKPSSPSKSPDGDKQQKGKPADSPSQQSESTEQSQQKDASESSQQSEQSQKSKPSENSDQQRPSDSGDEQQSQQPQQEGKQETQSKPPQDDESAKEPESKEPESSQSQQSQPPESEASKPKSDSPSMTSQLKQMLSGLLTGLGSLLKLILMLVLLVIVAVFVFRNWAAFVAWWASLFGGQAATPVEESEAETAASAEAFRRPFSSFRNPIGVESDPRRVIVITFQAYEAWMRDRGALRQKDETPDEFVRRAASASPQLSEPTGRLAAAYNRVVYGRGNAGQNDLAVAQQIWQIMSR